MNAATGSPCDLRTTEMYVVTVDGEYLCATSHDLNSSMRIPHVAFCNDPLLSLALLQSLVTAAS